MTQYNALRFPNQPATLPGMEPCGYFYASDLTVGTSILDRATPDRAARAAIEGSST